MPVCGLLLVLLAPCVFAAGETGPQHAVAMHGTPKYGPDFTHFEYVNANAPKGGVVRLGAIGTFDSFNAFTIKGNPASGLGLIYDTLMAGSADEPFTQYGLLAETIETPPDRSWVEFRLRKEAVWSDGSPVTPEDVIWTFHALREKGAPVYRFYYRSVAKVKKVGKHGIRFEFVPGNNRELPLILGQFPILPKAYWAGRDFTATTLEPPPGSGPYRIGRFVPGRFIEFERVGNYWGRDLAVNRGRHNFATLRYEYFRDDSVAVEAFKGGAFDYRMENNSRLWATAYDFEALRKNLVVREKISHQRPAGMQGFVFNLRRPIFKDPRVREALAYGFDFEWSNKTLFYGQYKRTRSFFDNSELAATGLPSPGELEILDAFRPDLPISVFQRVYDPPGTAGDGRIRKNLGKAMRLLTKAGWHLDDSNTLVFGKRAIPMRFEILLVQPDFERIVLPFTRNLRRLGVKVGVRTLDVAQYRRRLDTFDFDMIVSGWGQSDSPGNELREYWGSSATETKGSRNYPGVRDAIIDQLIEKVIAAKDRKGLVMATRALDRVLQWGYYVIPQYHADYDRVVYWRRFGRPERTPARGVQFDAWWNDKAGAARIRAWRDGN